MFPIMHNLIQRLVLEAPQSSEWHPPVLSQSHQGGQSLLPFCSNRVCFVCSVGGVEMSSCSHPFSSLCFTLENLCFPSGQAGSSQSMGTLGEGHLCMDEDQQGGCPTLPAPCSLLINTWLEIPLPASTGLRLPPVCPSSCYLSTHRQEVLIMPHCSPPLPLACPTWCTYG